jgi:hypothetical protein
MLSLWKLLDYCHADSNPVRIFQHCCLTFIFYFFNLAIHHQSIRWFIDSHFLFIVQVSTLKNDICISGIITMMWFLNKSFLSIVFLWLYIRLGECSLGSASI